MKKTQALIACGLALAVLSATTLFAAEAGQATAIVRGVHGTADYSVGTQMVPLKPGQELVAGTQIRTGPDSYVLLNINGLVSSVRISSDTTVTLTRMDRPAEGDTETMLDLQTGTVAGTVNKLSANSRYEIQTPNGVAGIRGTDFRVTAIPRGDGTFVVTFTSISGVLVCSAVINTTTVVRVLNTGQSWTPGQGDVITTPPALATEYGQEISQLSQIQTGAPIIPPPPIAQPFGLNGPPQTGEGSLQTGP